MNHKPEPATRSSTFNRPGERRKEDKINQHQIKSESFDLPLPNDRRGLRPLINQAKYPVLADFANSSIKSPKSMNYEAAPSKNASQHIATTPNTIEQHFDSTTKKEFLSTKYDSGIQSKVEGRDNPRNLESLFLNKLTYSKNNDTMTASDSKVYNPTYKGSGPQVSDFGTRHSRQNPMHSQFTMIQLNQQVPKQLKFQQNQWQMCSKQNNIEYCDSNTNPSKATSPVVQSPNLSLHAINYRGIKQPPPQDYIEPSRNQLISLGKGSHDDHQCHTSKSRHEQLTFQSSKIKILSQLKNYPDPPNIQQGIKNETQSKKSEMHTEMSVSRGHSVIGNLKNFNSKSRASVERVGNTEILQKIPSTKKISPIKVRVAASEFTNQIEFLEKQGAKLASAHPVQEDGGDEETPKRRLMIKLSMPEKSRNSRSPKHQKSCENEKKPHPEYQQFIEQNRIRHMRDDLSNDKDNQLSRSVEFAPKQVAYSNQYQLKKTINISPQKFQQQKRQTMNHKENSSFKENKLQLDKIERQCVISDSKQNLEDSYVMSLESSHASQLHLGSSPVDKGKDEGKRAMVRSPSPNRQSLKNNSKQGQPRRQPHSLSKPSNPKYFQTFQQGENSANIPNQLGKKKPGPLHMPQIKPPSKENQQSPPDFEQFYVFNNFAYQNLSNPSQLFGQPIVEDKSRTYDQLYNQDNAFSQQETNYQFDYNGKQLPKQKLKKPSKHSPELSSPSSQKKFQFPSIQESGGGTETQFTSKRNSQSYYGQFEKIKFDSPYFKKQQSTQAQQYLDRIQTIQKSYQTQAPQQNLASLGQQLYQQFVTRKSEIDQRTLSDKQQTSLNYSYLDANERMLYYQKFKTSIESTQQIIR